MKKLGVIGAAVVLTATLSGCTGGTGMTPETSDNYLQVYVVQLPDDDTVDCVTTYGMKAISCDWATRG